MIVDTSALCAIVFQEAGFETLIEKLSPPDLRAGIGAPSVAETGIVLSSRLRTDGVLIVAGLIDRLDLEVVPFGHGHWRAAVDAYRRFGRGRHRAGLNFGDCMSYAVAVLAGEPLLYVGEDFSHTDVVPA